jgi:hypothetical protein
VRSALEAAAAQADRRRRRLRWALAMVAGALLLTAAMLIGCQV